MMLKQSIWAGLLIPSAGNYDDIMLSEIKQYPSHRAPGIYVEELETGRTAYIDIELSIWGMR